MNTFWLAAVSFFQFTAVLLALFNESVQTTCVGTVGIWQFFFITCFSTMLLWATTLAYTSTSYSGTSHFRIKVLLSAVNADIVGSNQSPLVGLVFL